RVYVEWGYGKVCSLFAFLDHKKNLRLGLMLAGDIYKVGALLTNMHTCLYGSQTSEYFEQIPPPLKRYFSLHDHGA
ncbi:unnamed protein product, partial [Discosporangium mesarthrocarpum]